MNPISQIKLCAFADEADANRLGQIKALTENGISYLEIDRKSTRLNSSHVF